jgi:hypothetical protein
VGQFVASCRKYGIRPALYYIVQQNSFCGVHAGKMVPPSQHASSKFDFKGFTYPCGTTIEQYGDLVQQQLTELWTEYGTLAELWFDGGFPVGTGAALGRMIRELQPHAVAFQGPVARNGIRWAGSEDGKAAADDNWSTSNSTLDFGAGSPSGGVWAPTECDVTLQASGQWYWVKGAGLRSLGSLQSIYEHSVGRNGNMLLAAHPDFTGAIPPEQVARYTELGAWVTGCYLPDTALNASTDVVMKEGDTAELHFKVPTAESVGAAVPVPATRIVAGSKDPKVGRFVVAENQTLGQAVRNFTISVLTTTHGLPHIHGAPQWVVLEQAHSIGNKRIIPVTQNLLVGATAVRLQLHNIAAPITPATTATATLSRLSFHVCSMTTPPKPTKPCIVTLGTILTGVHIKSEPDSTQSGCCAACRAQSKCVAFNLHKNATCDLLSTEGGQKREAGGLYGNPN